MNLEETMHQLASLRSIPVFTDTVEPLLSKSKTQADHLFLLCLTLLVSNEYICTCACMCMCACIYNNYVCVCVCVRERERERERERFSHKLLKSPVQSVMNVTRWLVFDCVLLCDAPLLSVLASKALLLTVFSWWSPAFCLCFTWWNPVFVCISVGEAPFLAVFQLVKPCFWLCFSWWCPIFACVSVAKAPFLTVFQVVNLPSCVSVDKALFVSCVSVAEAQEWTVLHADTAGAGNVGTGDARPGEHAGAEGWRPLGVCDWGAGCHGTATVASCHPAVHCPCRRVCVLRGSGCCHVSVSSVSVVYLLNY